MGSHSTILFSILLISSIILVSTFETGYGEEVIATSIGFENSIILELKNSRGNIANIDSVRIWLAEDNEFKSFKTEQGWMGKNTPQGVIIFTSENDVKPGEGVKFGIKTLNQNPSINWKAIDGEGNVIEIGTAKLSNESDSNESKFNESENSAINDNSRFRLIPEQPSTDSNFRLIGENFVPKQNIDFYIQDDFVDNVRINDDGNIFYTGKIPSELKNDRTEFILQDATGNEKILSLRIQESENREISETVKLSIGNTPQQIKRGETITINGSGTVERTLTITTKYAGEILGIYNVKVGYDGRWIHDILFPLDLELGTVMIEIDDGITKTLRNIEIISATLINIESEFTKYEPGEVVKFSGTGVPNKEMSIIIEDSVGIQIYSRSITVGELGNVSFDTTISRDSIEGTYVLYTYQGDETGITSFGVGQEPQPIIILKPSKLNYAVDEDVEIMIKGSSKSQVSLILIDSANREILSESINLGENGIEMYKIDAGKLSSGSYIINAQRGESSSEARFAVGFTTGSGVISVQSTKSEYNQGDQMLILGSTGTPNSLLELKIINPSGEIIKKIDTFSDQSGTFIVDNFRIPIDGQIGFWKIDVKSGSNFDSIEIEIKDDSNEFLVILEKTNFTPNELMSISGTGSSGGTVNLKIFNSEGVEIVTLNVLSTELGSFSTVWVIPKDLPDGEYEIILDDGISNTSVEFIVI